MKKDFTNSLNIPALDFMSAETIAQEPAIAKKKAPKKKETAAKAAKTEIKSRRVQLVLKPSLYEAMHEYCEENEISVNQYICKLIRNDLHSK